MIRKHRPPRSSTPSISSQINLWQRLQTMEVLIIVAFPLCLRLAKLHDGDNSCPVGDNATTTISPYSESSLEILFITYLSTAPSPATTQLKMHVVPIHPFCSTPWMIKNTTAPQKTTSRQFIIMFAFRLAQRWNFATCSVRSW